MVVGVVVAALRRRFSEATAIAWCASALVLAFVAMEVLVFVLFDGTGGPVGRHLFAALPFAAVAIRGAVRAGLRAQMGPGGSRRSRPCRTVLERDLADHYLAVTYLGPSLGGTDAPVASQLWADTAFPAGRTRRDVMSDDGDRCALLRDEPPDVRSVPAWGSRLPRRWRMWPARSCTGCPQLRWVSSRSSCVPRSPRRARTVSRTCPSRASGRSCCSCSVRAPGCGGRGLRPAVRRAAPGGLLPGLSGPVPTSSSGSESARGIGGRLGVVRVPARVLAAELTEASSRPGSRRIALTALTPDAVPGGQLLPEPVEEPAGRREVGAAHRRSRRPGAGAAIVLSPRFRACLPIRSMVVDILERGDEPWYECPSCPRGSHFSDPPSRLTVPVR